MSHPLPDDVLVELGKVTWAAIGLEEYADSLCSFIHHANPREDPRSIGRKISDARNDLRSWEPGREVEQVDSWLARARDAIERRNAVFHSVPLVAFDGAGRDVRYALGEMPRGDRLYFERPLTVDGLRELRIELERAQQGWPDVVRLAHQNHP